MKPQTRYFKPQSTYFEHIKNYTLSIYTKLHQWISHKIFLFHPIPSINFIFVLNRKTHKSERAMVITLVEKMNCRFIVECVLYLIESVIAVN